jgi:hypothetical protein
MNIARSIVDDLKSDFLRGMETQNAAPEENPIANARRVMREVLKSKDLRIAYVSNIAMLLYDELHKLGYKPKLRHDDRNAIAEALLKLLFED